MKRLFSFIGNIIIHKWLGLTTPVLNIAMIDPKRQPYSWYWKQSKNGLSKWCTKKGVFLPK